MRRCELAGANQWGAKVEGGPDWSMPQERGGASSIPKRSPRPTSNSGMACRGDEGEGEEHAAQGGAKLDRALAYAGSTLLPAHTVRKLSPLSIPYAPSPALRPCVAS